MVDFDNVASCFFIESKLDPLGDKMPRKVVQSHSFTTSIVNLQPV